MGIRRLVFAGETLVYAALCAMLGLAPLAAAQETEPGQTAARPPALEEIIVTARKVEEPLQQTPVSVTAFSADDIERASMQRMQDIAFQTPGLRWEGVPTQGNTPTITVRGMSQNDSIPTLEAGVGIYFDGIFMGKLQGGQANLMDMERIEILKGPQGTLYGKNTLGGALNFVSHKPDGTFGGFAKVTLGNYSRKDFEGALQFPILGEELSARVAFQSAFREGYHEFKSAAGAFRDASALGYAPLDVADHGDGDENRGFYGRLTLRWTPNERFEALALGYRIKQRKGLQAPPTMARLDRANGVLGAVGPGTFFNFLNPLTGVFKPGCDGVAVTGCDPRLLDPRFSLENLVAGEDTHDSYTNVTNRDDLDVRGLGVELSLSLTDNLTLKSITGHRDLNGDRRGDSDGTPYAILGSDSLHSSRQFTQELQLLGAGLLDARLDFVLGAFFFDEEADDDGLSNTVGELAITVPAFGVVVPCVFLGPTCAATNPGATRNVGLDAKARSWALFGQGSYSLTERLRLTAGLRFSDEKRWVRNQWIFDNVSGGRVDARFDGWSYTAALDYQLSDDVMVYAKAARGLRSGGFDGRASFAAGALPFDTEKNTTFEGGLKSEWFDNRLRVNVAGFFSNFKDIQLTNLLPCPPDATSFTCTTRVNAGRAKVMGGELEVQAILFEGLQLMGGLEINKFDYQSGPLNSLPAANVSPEIPAVGEVLEPQNQPKLTFNISARYTLPPLSFGTLELQADWFHSGQFEGSPTNAGFLQQGTFGILNGRLTLFDDERGLQYSAFVKNALDRKYHFSGVDLFENNLGFGTRTWAPPLTYGFEITYRWGSDR